MSARFEPPFIQDNPTGWGPNTIPAQFKDMPYQPFSKSDRLGKVSDWTGATYQDRRYMAKYQSQYGAGGTQYAYYHEEDETSFQLVDTAKNAKPMYGRGRGFRGRGGFRGRWNSMNKPVANAPLQTLTKAQKIKRERQDEAGQKVAEATGGPPELSPLRPHQEPRRERDGEGHLDRGGGDGLPPAG